MTSREKINGHPGFIAFWGSNVKPVDKADTQLADKEKDGLGASAVANEKYQEKKVDGGEGGKA
jgi:hypothetical protein